MTPTWQSGEPPVGVRLSGAGKFRAVLRGLAIFLAIFVGLFVLLPLRMIERKFHGIARPVTGHIPALVSRFAILILGLGYVAKGRPMTHPGAIVANHSSWLDIFVLNAGGPLTFVSKDEVARWPGIGLMAKAAGTVFVRRDKREARAQTQKFREHLEAGDKLLFFPEGTSTDGQRVLPFKPTLFASVYTEGLRERLWVQPVTVAYVAPVRAERRFYGWWGDTGFGPHLAQVLGQSPQGRVEVTWHEPLRVADLADRKTMARAAEAAVRSVHPSGAIPA